MLPLILAMCAVDPSAPPVSDVASAYECDESHAVDIMGAAGIGYQDGMRGTYAGGFTSVAWQAERGAPLASVDADARAYYVEAYQEGVWARARACVAR